MKFTKQGIKWRQVIAVAMIAVPWFLRDELAGRMEQRATDAQQVLTEKDEQQEQQQQISDQRDLLRRIGQIQAQLRLVDAKVDSKVSEEEITEQARKSDDEFLGNFFQEAARKTAHDIESFDPNASESVIDAQFPLLRPKLYLPYPKLQAIAIL